MEEDIYIGETGRRLANLFREHLRDVEKKTTQMRLNQLRAILIFQITPTTTRLILGYPYTTGTQKAARVCTKIYIFQLGTLSTNGINEPFSFHLFTLKSM